MLRKVKHIGKKAAKYQFVAALNQLDVQGTKSWQPYKLVVVWTRRKKRKSSKAQSWHPSIENPYKGIVKWSGYNQESLDIHVTLFGDNNISQFEPKHWVFVLENESRDGKRKPIATARLDMSQYVVDVPSPRIIELQLKPLTRKLASAKLTVALTCVFLCVGVATEADLASLAGSTTSEDTIRLGDIDVADVRDFDDHELEGNSIGSCNGSIQRNNSVNQQELKNLTNQIELLSRSVQEQITPFQPDDIQNDSAISETHRASITSCRSKCTSISSRSSINRGLIRNDDVTTDSQRSSIIQEGCMSDASDGSPPIQKRRMRPSVGFVPSVSTEADFPPSLQGSPAPDVQKSLLRWCQRVTAGHQGIKVTNFTTSWRNGLALCALLHYYQPSLIDYESLNSLDGKANIKKALGCFNSLHIKDVDDLKPSIISEKNKFVSFLMSLRKHFHDDMDIQIGEGLLTCSEEKPINSRSSLNASSSYGAGPSLCEVARMKLLSDLEEKEFEDDVFSSALDDVLESQVASNMCDDTNPRFADAECVRVEKVFVSPIQKEKLLTELDKQMETLFLVSDQHLICKLDKNDSANLDEEAEEAQVIADAGIDDNSQENFFSLEQVIKPRTPEQKIMITEEILSEISEETTRDVAVIDASTAMDLQDKSSQFASVSEQSRTSVWDDLMTTPKHVEVIPDNSGHDVLPIDIILSGMNMDDSITDATTVSQTNHEGDVHSSNADAAYDSGNPFVEDVALSSKNSSSSNVDICNDTNDDISDLDIKLHLPNFNSTPTVKSFDEDSAIDVFSSSQIVPTNIDVVIPVNEFVENDIKEKNDKILIENVFEANELSSSEEEKLKDEDLQVTVDKLLKSSAARNKKAKTLELIEKAKVEALASKNEPRTDMESERQQVVRERAQRLIEETRATLGRSRKPANEKTTYDITNDIGTSGEVPTCNDTTNTSVISTTSSSSSVSFNCESSDKLGNELIFNDERMLNVNEETIVNRRVEMSTTTVNHSSSDTSDSPKSVRNHRETSQKQNFEDSDNGVRMIPPCDNIFDPAENSQPKLDVSKSKLDSSMTSQMNEPIESSSCITPMISIQDDVMPDDTTAHVDAMQHSNPLILERLSIAGTSDLHRRWSSSFRKKSSTDEVTDVASEMDVERMALESQHRLVEERATEVQLELQTLKESGRRMAKHREGELMQEWFQLVNKKNAIVRQQDQLALMEEEQEIINKVEKLHDELIPLMSIEDAMKTLAQKERELILLEKKVKLVNERDRIIQDMNEKEQMGLEEEERLQTSLGENMGKMMEKDDKCIVM